MASIDVQLQNRTGYYPRYYPREDGVDTKVKKSCLEWAEEGVGYH